MLDGMCTGSKWCPALNQHIIDYAVGRKVVLATWELGFVSGYTVYPSQCSSYLVKDSKTRNLGSVDVRHTRG